jgi:hypothetical protein
MTETILNNVTAEQRAAILDAEKLRVIDVTIRRARAEGYCAETIYVLRAVYPDHVGDFRDTSGRDCYGRTANQHVCDVCGVVHAAE